MGFDKADTQVDYEVVSLSRALTEDALIIRGNTLASMRHIC